MISLTKLRLVGWHFFDDACFPIGEMTLLAGDNGSGKSTIIDAIQYALAANLSRIKFNAAAADKKAGRTLEGYIRGKTGLESGEYLRDDAVGHAMLQFSAPGGIFSAGICVEAFKDEAQVREIPWIAQGMELENIRVSDEEGRTLLGRPFRDLLRNAGATVYDSKREYTRELTHKLGVFRRNADFNPYLDALIRSVGFTPLTSVDRFVCDYILEERPVDVSAMKSNLESYKEAEAEAEQAIRKIEALDSIGASAAEWRKFSKLILLQEYLKVRSESELAQKSLGDIRSRIDSLERELQSIQRATERKQEEKIGLESSRRDAEAALAANNAYQLVRNLRDRRELLGRDLARAQAQAERWTLLLSQSKAFLGRNLAKDSSGAVDIDSEDALLEVELKGLAAALAEHNRERTEIETQLSDLSGELADLERGLFRYPESSVRLREALQKKGVEAWIFADLVEVGDETWQNALEGWLNTLRFAVLVEPGSFGAALDVYDSLPRDIAGVALPNLVKMVNPRALPRSLSELILTDSPYARTYADYILGDVVRAELKTLKDFDKAVTRECMSYARHTASRMKEESYKRWYLGRSARERRAAFLRHELGVLRERLEVLNGEAIALGEREAAVRRLQRTFGELRLLRDAPREAAELKAQISRIDHDIADVDLSGVKNLEARIVSLEKAILALDKDLTDEVLAKGRATEALDSSRSHLASAEVWAGQTRGSFQAFLSGREHLSADCEAYYAERVAGVELKTLLDNFAGAVKRFQTRLENEADTYRKGVQDYNNRFNALLSFDPEEAAEAAEALKRLEDSELPLYREKIRRARTEAEQQFKEHFVSRLNEYIEEARESFREINDTLKSLSFGRDQYRFTLEEKSDRRGQLEVIRKAAQISELEGGLFATLVDGDERRAVEALFEKILRNDLDSRDVRDLCDYRTYFTYDIRMKDITVLDSRTGRSPELSLSKVIREKSGGEAQTPYYVAIAAGFYRFYKDKPEETIRLVLFDEAFNRMDDERIGVALDFFRRLKMQIVTAVPTEKLETIAPYMDSIALIVRHGHTAMVRAFKSGALAERGAQAGSKADAAESRPRRPPISKELADVSDPDAQGALPIEPMLPEE